MNVAHEVAGLSARNIGVIAFTRYEAGASRQQQEPGLTLHYVAFQSSTAGDPFVRDLEEGRSFVQGVLAHPAFQLSAFRSLHTHHWTSAIGLRQALHSSVRWIHTPHLLAREKALSLGLHFPAEVQAVESEILHGAKAVIALSDAEKRAMMTGYGVSDGHVRVIRNGASEAFFSVPMRRGHDGRLCLVTTARLCRQKGLDTLFCAAEIMVRKGVDLAIRIAGGSYNEPDHEAALRRTAQGELLRGRISFLGNVPHAMLPSLLADADIYVQPSRYESQGIAVLEAMAACRPVVVSDLDAIREIVSPGVSGILVERCNPAALAAALTSLHRAPADCESIGLSARAAAFSYSWAGTIKQTIDLVIG